MNAPINFKFTPQIPARPLIQVLQEETVGILADQARFTPLERGFIALAEAGCLGFERFTDRFSKGNFSEAVENTYRDLQADVLLSEVFNPRSGITAFVERKATRTAFNALGALRTLFRS